MMFIKKILWIFLFWIFILIEVCIFLLHTNMGIYFICVGIAYYVPGLTFNLVSGNWKNFSINHIKYCTSSGLIKISKCSVILNFKNIFDRKIDIDRLFFFFFF